MNKFLITATFIIIAVCAVTVSNPVAAAAAQTGEALFKQHCSACHAGGGNIINPQKTLSKKALASRGIASPEDIIKIMRNPGPGMTKFDDKAITDKDALQIGDYILKTFK